MTGEIPQIAYQSEKALYSGSVLDAVTGKPMPSAKIKIASGSEYQADENGKFIFNKLDLSKPTFLTFSQNSYTSQQYQVYNYGQNQVIYLYPSDYYTYYNYRSLPSSAAGAGSGVDMDAVMEQAPMENEDRIREERPVLAKMNKEPKRSANKKQAEVPKPMDKLKQEIVDDKEVNAEKAESKDIKSGT